MAKEVRTIPFEQLKPWLTKKHYAKRVPSVTYAYGLYIDGVLAGVVSYGTPASSTLLKGVCGEENAQYVLELNRLVVEEDTPKNSASYLVGNSLKQLPKPSIVISYADTGQGHVGYIYQATNFIYTGLSSKFTDPKVKGLEHQHHATYGHGKTNQQLREQYGDKLYFVERPRKHRYVYFVGCSKKIKDDLRYPILPYPKGKSSRYDAGNRMDVQGVLL